MGLVDKIKNAGSEKEIISLLSDGKKFQDVSKKTLSRWESVSKRRILELKTHETSKSNSTVKKKDK